MLEVLLAEQVREWVVPCDTWPNVWLPAAPLL